MKPEIIWQISKSLSLFIIVGFIIWGTNSTFKSIANYFQSSNEEFQGQLLKLTENIVTQQIEINNKLLDKKINSLNESITKLIHTRDQQISSIGDTVLSIKQSLNESNSSYYHDENATKDYDEVVIYNQEIKTKDNLNLPVAWAMYSPNLEGENKWTVGTYPLKISEQIVIAENDDRTDVYVEAWAESNVFNSLVDKKFLIPIEKVEWVKRKSDKHWSLNFRPSINVGMTNTFFPSLSLSCLSYGNSKRDMDWRFLGLGIGEINDDLTLQFIPIEYNIGNKLPLIENLFVSLQYVLIANSSSKLGLLLAVPF